MKSIKQRFDKLSYRKKVMIYYLLAVSIPFIIGTTYLYKTIVSSSQKSIDNSIEQRLEQDQASLITKLTTIHDYGYSFSINSTLNSFFANEHYDDATLINTLDSSIKPILSWMENTSKNYGDFRFLTTNETVPESEYFIDLNKHASEKWVKSLQKNINDNGYYYEPYHKTRNYLYYKPKEKQTFSILYFLPYARNTFLEVDISNDYLFNDIFNSPILNSGKMIFITDDGKIISNDSDMIDLEQILFKSIPKNKQTINFSQETYYIKKKRVSKLNGYLYSLVPASNIKTVTNEAHLTFILIIIILIILLLLISYIISTLLLKRINVMHKAVQTIQKGNFDISIPVNSSDEIDELAKGINVMSYKINDLINAVYKAEVNQKEAELSALQSQINPHFLFNTLETFRMMSELEQNEELSTSLVSLGNIMRYNLSASQLNVSLKDELKIIIDYVAIQNLLYNNRIILKMSIDRNLMETPMPSFILQPLIENSIVHNIHHIEEHLIINVVGKDTINGILISVSDNGVGMDTDQLASLREKMNTERSDRDNNEHIGLWNVNQRLQFYFKKRSQLTFKKNKANGITVYFDIPFEND